MEKHRNNIVACPVSPEEIATAMLKCTMKNPVSLIKIAIGLCIALCLISCTSVPFRSDPNRIGYTESGKASFYSMKFQFRTTASGERFNNFSLTAAHKTLPFGTKVKVTNVKNKKIVTVKINDRGPFVRGRIIDLTRLAFSRIGNTESGVVNVNIEVIE